MLDKLASPFRAFGPAGLFYVINRVLNTISPRLRLQVFEMMVQPIPDTHLLPERLRRNLEIREIRPGDGEMALMPVRPDALASRLKQDTVCLGAFRNGKLIGYMWMCFGAFEEDEARCTYVLTPARESVFDFDFYLFPENRIGVGFLGLWNGANEFLRTRSIRHTYSRVDRFNLASRRAHAHFGWKCVGRLLILRLLRFELILSSLAPFVHVSTRDTRRARLTLRPDALYRDTSARQH